MAVIITYSSGSQAGMRMLFVIVTLLVAFTAFSKAKPTKVHTNDVLRDDITSRDCSAPSLSALKKQLATHHVGQKLHPSYYMLPQLHPFIREKLARSESTKEFPLYGRQECPRSLHDISGEKNVQDRSLCPWYNVLSHNPDRYPVDIVEARCKCTNCIGVGAQSGAGCEPVYYNVPVLWRTNTCLEDGSYKYENGWQKIAVGCTCAMTSH